MNGGIGTPGGSGSDPAGKQATASKKGLLRNRKLRQGTMATAIIVCFIALILLVNIVFSLLSESFALRLDLTAEKLFVIGEETKAWLDTIGKDVQIYILTKESTFAGGDMLYYTQANETIRQFASYSPYISLSYVDLVRSPGFVARYPLLSLDEQTIILESAERVVTISFRDMFNTDTRYDTNYQASEQIISSKSEQVLAGALIRLLAERQTVVAILDGFGEQPSDALENLLTSNQYIVTQASLLTGGIGADVDVAVICAPNRDYTEDALRKLDAFLYNDGMYGKLLFYLTGAGSPPTPNLDVFLADWGIAVGEGIVAQGDSRYLVTNSVYWSVVIYSEEVYSKDVVQAQLATVMPEAKPLEALYERKDNQSVTELLSFGDTAYAQPAYAPEGADPAGALRQGPFPVMLLSRHFQSAGGEVNVSAVLVSGSSLMIGGDLLSISQIGNSMYLLSLFSALTPQPPGPVLRPKSAGDSFMPLSEREALWIMIVFVFLVPLVVVVIGAAVFIRGRHL